jgi:glycolate oxidase FAD binding subunit
VNASGPRRVRVGAARDALLGVRFVNGRGEIIKSGGRVMKNVTGLDLVKLLCGSHGTLGFLTEVTSKVLPKPEHAATLVLEGLDEASGIEALAAALASPFEPTGAAHLPAGVGADTACTAVRIEGFADSVAYRLATLGRQLRRWGMAEMVEGDVAARLWADIRDAAPLAEPRDRAIWRISTVPGKAPSVAAAISASLSDARWFYDWGGGLIWLSAAASSDAGAAAIRAALAPATGHATLVRAPDAIRRSVPVFQPQSATLMKLTAGIKQSFDPDGIFEPGRMYGDL